MKLRIKICLLALSAVALFSACSSQATTTDPIDMDAAKAVALDDAGVSGADVSFTAADLKQDDDLEYYKVNFTADGITYEYDIDALTGTIIERTASDTQKDSPTQSNQSGEQSATQSSGTLISEADAKQAALDHAGVEENQANFLRCKLDWEDGIQIYEVEFYTSDYKEYDYEINALTGEILSYDYDVETSLPSGTGSELTAEQAKELVLNQVPGATDADIWEFNTDIEDGRLEYEGEILHDGVKYEFEIDGYSGTIRSWEVESVQH